MDFDDLKRAWDICDRKLDSGIHLNTRRLRSFLRITVDAGTNRRTRDGIDHSLPVALAQRQINAHWMIKIGRSVAASIREACRADEIAGRLQSTAARVLRRHRTLRG
jgi:hypothetical protein